VVSTHSVPTDQFGSDEAALVEADPSGSGGAPPDHVTVDTSIACRCGHFEGAHEHYRRGTDCALCSCDRYRKERRRHPRPE
jgi:hypothetical protein